MNNDLKNLSIGRYERQLKSFSKDETELLDKIQDLITYLSSGCISQGGQCEPQEIETLRSQFEPFFSNIKNDGKTSSEFLSTFQEKKKAFTVLAEMVKEVPPPPATPPPGVNLCTPERHVDKECFCGNEMCEVGDSCTIKGVCEKATGCPSRQLNEDRKIPEEEGDLEFRLVSINSSGQMATVEEVKANLEKIQKLLKRCDFARLEDGTIEGMGYEGNVINEYCTTCQYKIIKSNKGLQFCSPEKHVDKICQCGADICIVGDSCSGGKCNSKVKECPARLRNEGGEERGLDKDKLEFQLVHVNSTGIIATMAEVKANLEKVEKLLMSCDIAKLKDGTIEGTGYGGKVISENCTLCQYKIIRNSNKGLHFCPIDKHVDEECQCGEYICDIGDDCYEGKCNNKDKECPVRQLNRNGLTERRENSGELEFKMVHINETGIRATVAEVEANPEKIEKLLKRCDFAMLEDGTVEGSGYGGKATDEYCESCHYKIIKSKNGKKFCPIKKHVDEECQCGENICNIGDSCNRGKCINKAKGCPTRKPNESEVNERKRNLGELDFKMVPIDVNGTNATIADVKANPEKMEKLLESCDIASLEDGTIEGSGYGGSVTTTTCESCPYKIIKSDNGTKFCTAEKHVDKIACQCGMELCNKGDICTRGTCQKNTVCPIGYQDKAKETRWKGSYNRQKPANLPDKPEFRLVPIDSNGPMATLKEVNENREQVLELLKECDIAKVEGGTFEGKGYDELDRSATVRGNDTSENTTELGHKVIKVEDPPSEEYNANVADKCCFILTPMGENETIYVLTNHSLLMSFPNESCSADCIYTPYDQLNYTDAPRICLDQIENYTCCSNDTGALCGNYGDATENNVHENGTCSSACKKIADCSEDKSNNWCAKKFFDDEDEENLTQIDNDTKILSARSLSRLTKLTKDSSVENASSLTPVPENCELIPHTEPEPQTAQFYPRALPEEPFTSSRNDQTTQELRSTRRGCRYWGFWQYSCTQAYNYPAHFSRKNWYQVGHYCYYFKHRCCSKLQWHCGNYSCPSQYGDNSRCYW